MTSCKICDDILDLFGVPRSEHKEIDLGSFKDALASSCPSHTTIIADFQVLHDRHKGRPVPHHLGFLAGQVDRSIRMVSDVKRLGMTWELLAVKKSDDKDSAGIGRILDPEWVHLDVVQTWRRKCRETHGDQCQNPLRVPPVSPKWLIDVNKNCVVPAEGGMPYVALSYRWTGGQPTKTTLPKLRQDGALVDSEILAQMPPKIQHAMRLAAALDERYLWVDFVCPEESEFTSQSDNPDLMASIFANAIFTIIVAEGEPEDGIRGLQGISEPRTLKQRVFKVRDRHLIVRNSQIFSLEHGHEKTQPESFQDFKVSGRKLIFQGGQVHWQCARSVQHEELVPGGEVDSYIDPRSSIVSLGFPDLDSLGHILSSHNTKDSTYDRNALADLAGLLNIFSRSFEGGFLYGVPETLFDRALAWRPQWSHTNLRRREIPDLPSWSWAAWQGMFTYQYGEAARVNYRNTYIQETIPITEWYTSSHPTDQPRRRIHSTWFEKRERRKDVSQPLPKGWKRLPAPDDEEQKETPQLYPDGCGEFLYRHPAFPDDFCDTWFYPFEVPEINTSTPFEIPEQTRYLFCRTWKAELWSQRSRNENKLTLSKGPGEPGIGELHLHNEKQLALWPENGIDGQEVVARSETGSSDVDVPSSESGKAVELVAINQCVVYKKTWHAELSRHDYPMQREEQVTVLWVEWKDGVAYRLACGWVEKDAWDLLQLEEVDLVLG
ncbi:unnamed protein product [Zymoseptoria tritici ST99CH_1A5]|uniref:Heterokaryon incompatibility domain-containing protein n=1 Tax=Zymoseptoria tritici ST99CH_1A5 TaxID=1276529 RepID=A0A1Y6LAN9_ZYMTR|nr:unnamed protein product [Zymoseptoria tritici ST99CH_3D1]SMY20418.1 unnamed protein product [Zymoseptoria tritici ST99CH_1A5]